jgi:hypothetical protein
MTSLLMLTRSFHCYGPIPEEWNTKIKGILEDIDPIEDRLSLDSLQAADLLEEVARKRMEDVKWIMELSKRLWDLEEALRKERGGGPQDILRQIANLILDIRGLD